VTPADLDAPGTFGDVDPEDALGDLEVAPGQWAAAAEVRVPAEALAGRAAVVLTGVGGSGISSDIAATLGASRLPVPLVVHKGYGLPAFASADSLVVALSCSGDTDETCSGAEAALERGARLVAITRGGRLAALVRDAGAGWIPVQTQCPPRHSLGMLLVPLLRILGLDDGLDEALTVLESVAERCRRDVPTADNPAKQLGLLLAQGGAAAVYAGDGVAGPAAYRLKSQLNENAKLPATWNVLPEAGHNEIVGWQEPVPGQAGPRGGVVVLRDPAGEHPRTARALDVFTDVVAAQADWSQVLVTDGQSPLARLASLLLLGDFASVYAALALGRDPSPIGNIDRLKGALREADA
jgi:glucose/mannose-6-phosphate isomerase